MKSRISCFDKTIFRKNLTRFAPAWGLYTVGALMGLVLLLDSSSKWMAPNLVEIIQIMSLVTPCYALLCAQLLFGDLYNSRMCNALHALPLRRETWFFTNVISGFVFHLIPTLVLTVLITPILALYSPEGAWVAGPLFLLGTNLQFLCFFGIAVFSAFCVGNRFAQAVVYGILNFASLIAGWLVDTLYIPQFYGVMLDTSVFFPLSPIASMLDAPFIHVKWLYSDVAFDSVAAFTLQPGDCFGYYFLAAAAGVGLLLAALWLYRRRKLECAGDFMAVKVLEPVFLVVYTLIVGAVFYYFTENILGMETLFYLFLGLAVGWFTGKMLLERSPRVFRLKSVLACGGLMAAFALTLGFAVWDPMGIETWVPEADQVETVGLTDGWYMPSYIHEDVVLTDQEDIQALIDIHQEALDFYETHGRAQFRVETSETIEIAQAMTKEELEELDRMNFSLSISLTYHMKDGRTISRYYNIWMGDDTGKYLLQAFSRPEALFGNDMTEARFLEENSRLTLRDTWHGEETVIHAQADIQGLYRAILADCEAGRMAQDWNYHQADDSLFWLYLEDGSDITIFSNAENTINWLRTYGLDVDALLEHKAEMYG